MGGKFSGYRSILVLFTLILILTSCEKELVESEESKVIKKLSAQELELIEATNNLSLNIIKAEFEQNNGKNFLFSPISTGMALGMIYNGVGEKERYRIQQFTGLESLVENEINKSYNEFLSFLQLNYDQADVFCANSMWFSYGLDIDENYRTKIMAYYDAEISEINFTKKTSLQSINHWGSLKSGGYLDQLSTVTPSGNYSIYLINAFGLNTSWENGRNFIRSDQFTGLDGEISEVRTINLDQVNLSASENSNFNFIEIPLKGHNFLFSIIDPAEDGSLGELIGNFTFDELISQIGTKRNLKANVSIPEISFVSENPLKSTLGKIGLQSIFQSSLDLSSAFISKNPGISEINQVARFNIKGQAMTGDDMDFLNPELRLINLNRPFLYFVRDKHTKSVIFAGYYTAPAEE
jgi:serpin B